MTIKEKIDETLTYLESKSKVDEIEQIADDFAIGFAEWLYKFGNTRLPNGNWIINLGLKPLTSKEVLEKFKKDFTYDTKRKSNGISKSIQTDN